MGVTCENHGEENVLHDCNYTCFLYGEAEALKGLRQAWRYSLDMARIPMPFCRVSFLSCSSHGKRGKEDGIGLKRG